MIEVIATTERVTSPTTLNKRSETLIESCAA